MAPPVALRNGTGAPHKAFPRQPVLLAAVPLPFKGTFEHVLINFNVSIVQDLLADDSRNLHALNADLEAQEAALDADETLTPEAKEAQRSPLWLAAAWRVIDRAVYSVEWDYDDPPPDPHAPDTWTGWPDLILVWIGQAGIHAAGVQFGVGPLSQQARQSQFWATTASLTRMLNGS
jgi:hypothetical protein